MNNHSSLVAIQHKIIEGKTTCKNVVEYFLKNISNNKHLNAFIEVYEKEALQIAESIDLKFKKSYFEKPPYFDFNISIDGMDYEWEEFVFAKEKTAATAHAKNISFYKKGRLRQPHDRKHEFIKPKIKKMCNTHIFLAYD